MPELPEVESLRRGLEKFIVDQEVLNVRLIIPKFVWSKSNIRKANPLKEGVFLRGVKGNKIVNIERRAKNLMIKLDDGGLIFVHLKMTGQLVYKKRGCRTSKDDCQFWGGHPIELSDSKLPNKHTGIIFELEDGVLFYNDTRKFGYVLYYENMEEFEKENHFKNLGFEPLGEDFTFGNFSEKLKQKNGVLKKIFLEQKVVVGLGNIYADEVCFEAGVKPDRQIKSLTNNEIKKLYEAIKRIIPRAIELGGSSVANYLLVDGERGNYAREHKVYKRGGKKCLVCGATLSQGKVAGRTTVWCEKCQK